jgi:peptide chain release factor 3
LQISIIAAASDLPSTDTVDTAAPDTRNVPSELIAREVARRHTFGIISHPDNSVEVRL